MQRFVIIYLGKAHISNHTHKFLHSIINILHYVLQEDLYYPHPLVQDILWGILHNFAEPILTRWPFSKLREKAIKVAMEHVHYNDECSRYLGIGIVVKVLISLLL